MALRRHTNYNFFIILGVIVLIVIAVLVMKNNQTSLTELRAKAGTPAACTKESRGDFIVNRNATVTAKDSTAGTFTVTFDNEQSGGTLPLARVVYNCPQTQWTRAKGGGLATDLFPMSFDALNVGDRVVLNGNFVDRTKFTVYPKSIQDTSLHPEHFRGDITALSTNSFTVSNVVNGPGSVITVLRTNTNRCYNDVRFRDITPKTPKVSCSTLAEGQRVEIDGIYSDIQQTVIGPFAQIVIHPKD